MMNAPAVTAALLCTALSLGGCATENVAEPAVLHDFGPQTEMRLKGIIGEELDRANITFGAGDPTKEPVLVVLPSRPGTYETMSPAEPIVFDIRTGAEGCHLAKRNDDGTILLLTDIACVPLN